MNESPQQYTQTSTVHTPRILTNISSAKTLNQKVNKQHHFSNFKLFGVQTIGDNIRDSLSVWAKFLWLLKTKD